MHRTLGDGFIVDPVGGQNIYADENPPLRDATQVRHQEMNALQEEICNVIEEAGAELNLGTESVQQMVQLKDAINTLISNSVDPEITARQNGDNALQGQIDDHTSEINANTGAISTLDGRVDGHDTVIGNHENRLTNLDSNFIVADLAGAITCSDGATWVNINSSIYYKLMGNIYIGIILLHGNITVAGPGNIIIDLNGKVPGLGSSQGVWRAMGWYKSATPAVEACSFYPVVSKKLYIERLPGSFPIVNDVRIEGQYISSLSM